jgi:hypothetical protein
MSSTPRSRPTKAIKRKKNPISLPFSPDNLRRWAILNFPRLVPKIEHELDLEEFPYDFLEVYVKARDDFKIKKDTNLTAWNYPMLIQLNIYNNDKFGLEDLRRRYLFSTDQIYRDEIKLTSYYYFLSLMKFFTHIYVLIFSLSIPNTKKKYFWDSYMGSWENLEKLRLFMLFRNIGDFKLGSTTLNNIITGRKALINQWKSLLPEEQNKQIFRFLEENA